MPLCLSSPRRLVLGVVVVLALSARLSTAASDASPDDLYRQRADLSEARRAADLWAGNAATDFDAAWKLSRACYWLGTHGLDTERRSALKRGVKAGETAVRLHDAGPDGHFWLAANMGALAESFGLREGLKYRGRIRDELERVLALTPGWQEGSANAALGQWYMKVPRLFGGNKSKAEEQFRRALEYNPNSRMALVCLAELLVDENRKDEARLLLQRAISGAVDPDWIPEDTDWTRQATSMLTRLRR